MWKSPIFPLRSLKSQVAAATLLVVLAGMWSLSFFASRMLHQDMERVLSAQQYSTVSMLAAQLNEELESRSRSLANTAFAAMGAMGAGPVALQAFLDERVNLLPLFNEGMAFTDHSGKVIAGRARSSGKVGGSLAHDDAVMEALRGGKASIGRPVAGITSSTPTFTISVPVFDANNRVIGSLSGFTDLGSPSFLDLIPRNRYGRTGTYSLIAPRHQLIVTSSDRNLILGSPSFLGTDPGMEALLSGKEGSLVHLNAQGVEVLTSVKRIPAADWLVAAHLPTDEAFQPILEMKRRMWLATALLSLLALLITGWLLNRRLSQLSAASDSLASLPIDELPQHPLPVLRDDEIGQLISRFNHVLDALRERELSLRESEARFRALHDASFGGIAIHDQGRIIDCNQGLSEMTGFDKEELLCLDGISLIAPESREEARRNIQSGYDQTYEAVGLRKDGSRYPLRVVGKRIQYQGKSVRVTEFRDISEQKLAEEALRQRMTNFRSFFDKNTSVMLLTNPFTGEIVAVNDAACRFYGYRKEDLVGQNISLLNTMQPDEIAEQRLRALHGECNTFHFLHRLASGELRDVEVHLSPIQNEDRPLLFSIIHDITERKRAEERQRLAASVFSHAREGIMITGADGTIIDVNDSFTRITGYSHDEALGRNPRMLQSGRQSQAFYASLWDSIRRKGQWYGEIRNRRKNGEIFIALQTISAIFDRNGKAQHYVSLFSDITAIKEHEKRLEHIAHFDMLTALPNRVLLADRMKQAMAQAERRGQLLAVAYLDLDGFKAVNDAHGHEIGDRLLVAIAERMKQTLREADTLARLGGDEFIAVLMDLGDTSTCLPMLGRLLEAASTPVRTDNLNLQVSASIGVTFYPQDEAVDADQLLRQADQAMYQAKLSGKNRVHVFDAEHDRNVRGRHESVERIRRALADREFVLHYQPKVNMRTGTIIGAEALIRWQHSEKELSPPSVFLPLIEDHPLGVELGEWVIDAALTQIEDWRLLGIDLPVSVNVSARQLLYGDFSVRLREILALHPSVTPDRLEIEVLETSALEDITRVSQIIEECRTIGVGFALDDFGTGYSSLTYLKRLSVDQLKIDQSFVRNMLDDPDDLSILGGVLSMATAFRRQVIAEGVETVAHGSMLLQLGCELAQGYGIARPMPAGNLPAWIDSWRPDERWSSMRPAIREDLPLLFAGVEHRAWATAVEDFLHGKRSTLPLAHHQCRFNVWLETEGLAQLKDRPSFQRVMEKHRTLHELANALCAAKSPTPETPKDPGLLARFQRLRDALTEELQSLIAEGHQPADD